MDDTWRRWRHRILRSCVHLVVLFAIGEAIARRYIAGPLDLLERSDDPVLLFRTRPGKFHADGYFVRLADVEYDIDADGCRRWGVDPTAATDRLAMLFVGSSRTFGMGVPLEDTFPWRAWDELRAERPGAPLASSNCSVPGYDLVQNLHFAALEATRFAPKVLVVSVNFAHLRTPIDWMRITPQNALVRLLTRHVRLARLAYLVYLVQGADAFHEAFSTRASIEAGLDEVEAAAAKSGTRIAFVLHGSITSPEVDFPALLAARQLAFHVVPDLPKGPELYLADDDHWNARGHRRIADDVAPFLREMLVERAR